MPAATNRQLAVRLAVSRALGRTRDLDGVYRAALSALAECLEVSRASVLLFDPDGVMRFKAYRNLSSEYRAAVQGHSPWTPESVDAEPLLVSDVTRDPSLEAYLPAFAREGIAALGFIPLVSLGRVIGKFMLYYVAPHAFDDEEVQLAEVIASAVAFAVERARAHEGSRGSDAPQGYVPNASVIGPWEWEVSPDAPAARHDGLPSGKLRQVRECDIEADRDCLKILGLDGKLLYVNPAGVAQLGAEDSSVLLRRRWVEFWEEKDREVIEEA